MPLGEKRQKTWRKLLTCHFLHQPSPRQLPVTHHALRRDLQHRRRLFHAQAAEEFARRFAREAQAIAALNHPNICTLYDVGPNYLVMELVEGPTLAERIKRGALGFEEAVKIAQQIADALEAAHERGIVHRDLKPANIKITSEGRVKILDFGLAKPMVEQTVSAANPDDSPILTMSDTVRDVIPGTPGYMSPEQARGQTVDQRADIWAFGVVLWEMVTGRRLFGGETVSDTLAAVLKSEPDWENAPPEWRRLLRACLAKDPRQRLRNIADALRLVDDDYSRLDSTAGTARTGRRRALRALAATLTVLAAGGIGVWISRRLRPARTLFSEKVLPQRLHQEPEAARPLLQHARRVSNECNLRELPGREP